MDDRRLAGGTTEQAGAQTIMVLSLPKGARVPVALKRRARTDQADAARIGCRCGGQSASGDQEQPLDPKDLRERNGQKQLAN